MSEEHKKTKLKTKLMVMKLWPKIRLRLYNGMNITHLQIYVL